MLHRFFTLFRQPYSLSLLLLGFASVLPLTLWLADRYLGWHATYVLMARLLLLGIIATLRAPEPVLDAPATRPLEQAMFAPLRDFFSRNNAWLILLLIVLYKLDDAFAMSLSTPFLIRGVGFNAGDVGLVNKTLGLLATIIGALYAGLLMQRMTLFRALLLFGILQTISNAGYWLLASLPNIWSAWQGLSFWKTYAAGWAQRRSWCY